MMLNEDEENHAINSQGIQAKEKEGRLLFLACIHAWRSLKKEEARKRASLSRRGRRPPA